MSFPDSSAELHQLQCFLSAAQAPEIEMDDTLEEAIGHAESLLSRLNTPVRVAFTGPSRSGKSSLINLIVGEELLPTDQRNYRMPPVIVRYGKSVRTMAQWWDREEVVFEGQNLNAALAETPDLITIEIDLEDLGNLWLIDVSDADNPEYDREAIFALIQLADAMVWCSNASSAWGKDERALWGGIPSKLKRNSILAMTHSDQADDIGVTELQKELPSVAAKNFRATVPIATLDAWDALMNETDVAQQVWIRSGAPVFLSELLELGAECRRNEIERVRKGITEKIDPLRSRLPSAEPQKRVVQLYAVKDEIDETPVAAHTDADAVEKAELSNPALDNWKKRLAQISEKVSCHEISDDAALLENFHEAVNEFIEDISDDDLLPDDAEWVVSDLEKASDLLVLMQYESSGDVSGDTMRIIAQLTDTLAWAGCLNRAEGNDNTAGSAFVS